MVQAVGGASNQRCVEAAAGAAAAADAICVAPLHAAVVIVCGQEVVYGRLDCLFSVCVANRWSGVAGPTHMLGCCC